MTAMTDHPLIETGACPNCTAPVNDQGTGAWVHTLTGQYRCPLGSCPEGDGYAAPPITGDMLETARDEAYAAGQFAAEDIANETMFTEDEVAEKVADAEAKGRKDMHAELDESINAAVDGMDDATADELRDALATAWNRCAP